MTPETLTVQERGPTPKSGPAPPSAGEDPRARYARVRAFTVKLAEPLAPEDQVVQSMPDVSPTKWHLAHVSWFFETFMLEPLLDGYSPLDPAYAYLFNSYYVQAGERHCRDQRGYISRPTVREVLDYRRHVDAAMDRLLERATADAGLHERVAPLLELGLNHEQQHQELLVTDIKHVFSVNPLRPAYRAPLSAAAAPPPPLRWVRVPEGIHRIGHDGTGFAYDNEWPRHRTFLEPAEVASRLVTNGEFIAFIEDGGYRRPELWLSEGWATAQEREWTEPFYWERRDGAWIHYTLGGSREVDPHEPIAHVSYFEADAYARWAGARLPTEQEWEVLAAGRPIAGNFVDAGRLHPVAATEDHAPDAGGDVAPIQLFGDVWEWTRSQYSPYPGYAPAEGAIGEYNGKFMCNQFVLRGGSCATSREHVRATYRNFFPPDATWQFTGIRLARDS